MVKKSILCRERVREITGSFAFIEHRFLREGFISRLTREGLILYLFLILAADRHGISFYHYDKICSILRLTLEEYIEARNLLIDRDLIAFDGTLFQVLSLPMDPPATPGRILAGPAEPRAGTVSTIGQTMRNLFGGKQC